MGTRLSDILRKTEIFERLPEADLQKIGRLLRERRLAENHVLVRQGDQGDAMYIIVEGRVKVAVTDQFGREKVLAFLGDGQFFGDMALLTGAPRSATVSATTNVRVLELRKDDFDVLVANNVDVMREMLQVMAQRQALINQRVAEESSAEAGSTRGLLTVVYSPRGGAGKSTIAANLAVALAQTMPDRVVLVDLDLLFGQLAVMLNLSPRTSLATVTASALKSLDRESFSYYLTTHEDSSLRVLIGASRPEEGEMVTGDHIRTVMDLLRRQFTHVVVDTNTTFSEANLTVLEMADQVLVVATPELVAARDLRECQRIFFDLLGFSRQRFEYVVNQTSPYKGIASEHLEQALEIRLAHEIPFGGPMPSLAALEGYPVVMRWPNSPTSKALTAIAADLDRRAREALALAGR
jgi:MinD-like ATPase involved in chromosome partitioning or flagellar assembly